MVLSYYKNLYQLIKRNNIDIILEQKCHQKYNALNTSLNNKVVIVLILSFN